MGHRLYLVNRFLFRIEMVSVIKAA